LFEQGFGDDALGQTQTCDLFNQFKSGQMSVDQDDHSGQPKFCTILENVAKVFEVIRENRKQTIHVICNRTVVRDMPEHFVRQT
jgi:hypothetical protein